MDIKYIDRSDNTIKEEKVLAKGILSFLYSSSLGKIFLECFVKNKFLSVLYGKFQDMSISKRKIHSFIKEYNIDMNDYIIEDSKKFKSFNEFFYRKIKEEKRPMLYDKNILISPADSKVLLYENIDNNFKFPVKGYKMNLKDLIQDDNLTESFVNGSLAIFRLAPSDYHRYCFVDYGYVKSEKNVKGDYYSVNPIALDSVEDLFSKNKRNLTLIETENFGDILYIEVGATFVGSIVQTYNPKQKLIKGEEKGYFKFGGSTIILLFKQNFVSFDQDLIENSLRGIETSLKAREKIGHRS